MRDFDRDLLNADRSGRVIEPGEFLWSASSHLLFENCPRAWFYTHCLAQGGWEIFSRQESCHAYLLKYLETKHSFISRTLREALAQALQEILDISCAEERTALFTECFQRAVTERYFEALEDVENLRYLSDPKYTFFAELHYRVDPDQSVQNFFRGILEEFKRFFREFERLSLAELFAQRDPLQWHNDPREFITFYYASGKLVIGPCLYFFTGKEFHVWKIRSGKLSEAEKFSLLQEEDPEEEHFLSEKVISAFCLVRYGEAVRCVVHELLLTEERLLVHTLCVKPVPEEFVRKSSERIRETLSLPGGIRQENFICTEDLSRCAVCRFRALCGKSSETATL